MRKARAFVNTQPVTPGLEVPITCCPQTTVHRELRTHLIKVYMGYLETAGIVG